MDVSVMTDHSGHNPVCDYRYPTKTCGQGNPAVRSSWDNVSSPRRGGRASREGARRATKVPPDMRAVHTRPIEMRINEMIAGIRADAGIKLDGDDR